MFIIRQLSSFCWPQWMVCVSCLLVCCFLICSQEKRPFTIKHGPKTTCFPALLTSWNLWDSLLCKDCLATCRTLLYCFESVSVIIKAEQNGFLFVCLFEGFFLVWFFLSWGEKLSNLLLYEDFFSDITTHTALWGESVWFFYSRLQEDP